MNRSPDVTGTFGQAWKIDTNRPGPADWSACLAVWLIQAPGQGHGANVFYLSAIHLRDIPGVPPAHKNYPEAEYELSVLAVNAASLPDADSATAIPLDRNAAVLHQFHGITDQQVAAVAEQCVRDVVDGNLPAETRTVSLNFGPDVTQPPFVQGWMGSGLSFRQYWGRAIDQIVTEMKPGSH